MKTYYRILKSESDVETFSKSFDNEIKPAIPAILEQLNNAVPSARVAMAEIFTGELEKLSGTCEASIRYAIKHTDDGCPLAGNEEVMNQLKQIKAEIKAVLLSVEQTAELSKTSSIFASLAQGNIPPGYLNTEPEI